MIDQDLLDQIWYHLATGQNVLVMFQHALTDEQAAVMTKPIFNFLRPCGVVEESSQVMRLQNQAYIVCKRQIPIPPQALNVMQSRLLVLVI